MLEKLLEGKEEQLKELEKVIRIGKPPRGPRHPGCCPGHPWGGGFNWTADCHGEPFGPMKMKRGETLSDVLGDIPMSAVKSYKIKETRDGKKITIEVSDDYPVFQAKDVMFIQYPHPPLPPE
ncbi:MAG: hypothetical protein V1733_05995 [bacterium]